MLSKRPLLIEAELGDGPGGWVQHMELLRIDDAVDRNITIGYTNSASIANLLVCGCVGGVAIYSSIVHDGIVYHRASVPIGTTIVTTVIPVCTHLMVLTQSGAGTLSLDITINTG